MVSRFRAILARRDILTLLVIRDLRVKYTNSKLGYFWSVLDPLLMAGVYWFVFTQIFSRGVGQEPYLLFLLLGILPWTWAQGAIRGSLTALTSDAKLVRSSNLSREIWILRLVGSRGMDYIFSLPALVLFILIYWQRPSLYLLAFPLAVLIQIVFLVGIGLTLAPLAVLYDDVKRLARVVMRVLFYFSPVIYGVRDVQEGTPDWIYRIYILNPMAGIFDLYRAAFFPDHFAGWSVVAVAGAVSLGFLALGMFVFSRLEGRVLKEM